VLLSLPAAGIVPPKEEKVLMNKDPQLARLTASVERILADLPPTVTLQAAAKTRTLPEVEAVIAAGITQVGYNYIQEALPIIQTIGGRVSWHMIGHLQRNKAKLAVQHFDMVETVDSLALAQVLDRHCAEAGRVLPVLIEVNSGREENKSGVLPEQVEALVGQIATLPHLRVEGLMTMGPRFGDPEDSRPYFQATRRIFERLALARLPNVAMRVLSMGMSNSYRIAIQEGATLIRLGTLLFGGRV
jgi:pyridoxal phosphate enzyme (YggS family)